MQTAEVRQKTDGRYTIALTVLTGGKVEHQNIECRKPGVRGREAEVNRLARKYDAEVVWANRRSTFHLVDKSGLARHYGRFTR